MKDYLVFMSDQHSARVMGCSGDAVVRTPNMDALAKDGVQFESAYTCCPLCVPARMSMLTSRMPSKTGVFTNAGSIPEEMPTFLHQLAIAGYETVLCGRMHFEGLDQRHGFTKRIAYDVTPTTIGCGQSPIRKQMGMLSGEPYALQIVGGGNNHVHHYDDYVVQAALDYLAQPHEKPQCIVVGIYCPHSPYIGEKELYEYYLDKVEMPPHNAPVHPVEAAGRLTEQDPEVLRALRAAYYANTERVDRLMGEVRFAWNSYLKENRREGIFVYLSDHGDMDGNRGFWAKNSFYEDSIHIPFLIAGDNIPTGKKVDCPVSILDLGPTLCTMAGIEEPLPEQDGISLQQVITGDAKREAPVYAEWITNPYMNGTDFGRMVMEGDRKLLSYNTALDKDQLFCPQEDPWELHDLSAEEPETAQWLHKLAWDGVDAKEIVRRKLTREKGINLIRSFARCTGAKNTETWEPTAEETARPEAYVSSKRPLPPPMQAAWERGTWIPPKKEQ